MDQEMSTLMEHISSLWLLNHDRIIDKSNIMGATNGSGNVYPNGAHKFPVTPQSWQIDKSNIMGATSEAGNVYPNGAHKFPVTPNQV
jgi:hypothetical protein